MIDWFDYGDIIERNKTDTVRKYFIIECSDYFFKRYMFKHDWKIISYKNCSRKGLYGSEVTVKRYCPTL